MKTCFVIMGFGKKTSIKHKKGIDLDFVYNSIIKPAVAMSDYTVIRADEITGNSLISRKMFLRLVTADLVIADITSLNANAMYELGVRHALRPYSTIIMKDDLTDFPFDINDVPYIKYSSRFDEQSVSKAINELSDRVQSITNELDSPFFTYLSEVPPINREIVKKLEEKIRDSSDSTTTYFSTITQIQNNINEDRFDEALFKINDLLSNNPEDTELKIKKSFCMYKIDENSITNLKNTLQYIYDNNLSDIVDVNILCIIGAIKKRLWLKTSVEEYLSSSIEAYENAFYINKDFYPGSNYAYLLLEKSNIQSNLELKKELFYQSKSIYRSILQSCHNSYTLDEWAAATLSTAFLVIGDEKKSLQYSKDIDLKSKWKKTTHNNQYKRVQDLLVLIKQNI